MNNPFQLTVKELKVFIENNNIQDDAIILIERIKDIYFEKHNWKSVAKKVDDFETHEYIEAFCACKYEDNNLYINAHY